MIWENQMFVAPGVECLLMQANAISLKADATLMYTNIIMYIILIENVSPDLLLFVFLILYIPSTIFQL